MPNGRSYFRQKSSEEGRHQAYSQALDGEYAFDPSPGTKPPFETYNDATRELQGIIDVCVRDGKRLRARGSLWSLSTAAVTEGRLIDPTALRVLLQVPPELADPRYAGDVAKLRFVECGNTVAALNDALFKRGLSLKASGSNNGQMLAGAVSTGTHGGAYRFGALPEMVVGLHLIVGPNKHVYLEPASRPVMKADFARMLGAELVQDDTLFHAALVSFGSFGVVHGLLIETRDLFTLHAVRWKRPYDDTVKAAIAACDPTLIPLPDSARDVPRDKPYHFELFLNPNEEHAHPHHAYVHLMYEDAYDPVTYVKPPWDGDKPGLGASGLNVLGSLLNKIPSLLDGVVVKLLNDQVEEELEPYVKRGIIGHLFRGETTQGRTLACGVGMPIDRALEAMDIALKTYKRRDDLLPVLLSFRFVKRTQALLGFTRFEPTAVFEMDSVNNSKTRAFFEAVLTDFEAAGIPLTLHWGKFNSFLTPERVRRGYGDAAVSQWIASRESLLESPAVRQTFTNQFLTRLGLET